jgi:hypothetical protein
MEIYPTFADITYRSELIPPCFLAKARRGDKFAQSEEEKLK